MQADFSYQTMGNSPGSFYDSSDIAAQLGVAARPSSVLNADSLAFDFNEVVCDFPSPRRSPRLVTCKI